MINVFERVKNVFNAMIGRKATCGGNCSCHSEDTEANGLHPYAGSMGTCMIDISGMHPDIQQMFRELAAPDKQAELQAELEAAESSECGCESTQQKPQACVHLDYIPVCHMKEGDAKPETCSASTCPVRMFQVALEEMQKKAAMIAYG